MKRMILILIRFLIAWGSSLPMQAQMPIQYLISQEQAREVLTGASPNGNIYQVVESFDTQSAQDQISYTRYNSDLSIQQTRILDFPAGVSFRLDAMQPLNTGGLTIAGITRPILTENDSVFVVRLDPSGSFLWSLAFQLSPKKHEVSGIVETSDGGVVVYGLGEDPAGFGNLIFLQKISINGTSVWRRQISSEIAGASHFVGEMVEDAGGDLWMFGSTRLSTEGSWLARLGSDGQTKAVTFLRTHNLLARQPEPKALKMAMNGGWDLFYSGANASNGDIGLAIHLNMALSPMLVRRFSLNNRRASLDYVSVSPGGEYIWTGNTGSPGDNSQGVLLNLASGLDIRRALRYGNEHEYTLRQVVPRTEDAYLLTGMADPDGMIDDPSRDGLFPWLGETDNAGELDCGNISETISSRDTTVETLALQLDNLTLDAPESTAISLNSYSRSLT
ncbi:MAG: hypothetical protein AAFV07_06250, partial [Bacteroidota bacterium]